MLGKIYTHKNRVIHRLSTTPRNADVEPIRMDFQKIFDDGGVYKDGL